MSSRPDDTGPTDNGPTDTGPSGQRAPLDESLVEAVLSMVEQVPAGRVVSYGDVAELIERGGPRQVAAVLSRWGAEVPWWRVIRADGRPAEAVRERAVPLLVADGILLRRGRVDLRQHRWLPEQPPRND